jgi:poly(A) polymerase
MRPRAPSSVPSEEPTMTQAATPVRPGALAQAAWLVRPETQAVFKALADAGHTARAVGGVVRNALAGLPVTDIDIATPARPEAVIDACTRAGLKCIPTGIEHGTVTVVSGGEPYEVTTLRRDVETDGRRATVAFTADWALDAERRDLTMNALYCDPDGTVHDPVSGYDDLVAGRVRFIGNADERIAEDYLRILRFFRFHAQFGRGPLDSEGMRAAVRGRHGLARLSAERVRAEMVKLLVAPRAADAIDAMGDSGLLTAIIGAAPRPGLFRRLVDAEAAAHAQPDAMLRLSALAVAVEEDIPRLADHWRLSKAERDALLVVGGPANGDLLDLDPPRSRQRLYRMGAGAWRRQCLLIAAARPWDRDPALARYRLASDWLAPAYPLRGADALNLGVRPGPDVGAVLAEAEAWWVEQDFPPEPALRAQLAAIVAARQ